MSLLGIPLPITVVWETWRFYEPVPEARDAALAEKAMEAVLAEQLHQMVDPYGSVRSTLCSSRQKGDTLVVTLSAECEEQIGQPVPIYAEGLEAPEDTGS